LNDAGVRKALADRGVEAVPSTPEEFAQFQRDEIVRWKAVVKAGNITGTR
jgi:tripartite-type tricarboxylate transporter receptor subunit TctC